jgi:hypothetical protein
MKAGRIVAVVAAALVAVLGVGILLAGGTLVWAHGTQRDSRGYYTSPVVRLDTATSAITAAVDLDDLPGDRDWLADHPVGTVRIRAESRQERPLFVGIAPTAEVRSWLAGVAHERVRGANFDPFVARTALVRGGRIAEPPGEQEFWAVSATGSGPQQVRWATERGRWTAVVMNADATPGIAVAADVGARTAVLLPIGIGAILAGLVLLAGAAAAMIWAFRGHRPLATAPLVPGTYPVRLDGHFDPTTGRWLWLVKWLLLVPHLVVLALLWLAVAVITPVAGVCILITGRYPRPLFDFTVGVVRWTWRVSFYGLSAFGTDRYPPFGLHPDPMYPADLTVPYPERLSRGLVLVKWWLLALPQYVVVALFAGGWGVGWTDGPRFLGSTGIIGILALLGVVILAFTGRYPDGVFDVVMGMNRWCYRVLTYVLLLRDEYPPFRLDQGGADPGSLPYVPPPPPVTPSNDVTSDPVQR